MIQPMWIASRVGKGNSLSVLRKLRIYGSRYKIEKIQKLCENFEKACWRSVRVAEEAAYHRKYHFLKHCLNVINTYRKGQGNVFYSPPDPCKLSQFVLNNYNMTNSGECLETAERLLNKATRSSNVNIKQEQNSDTDKTEDFKSMKLEDHKFLEDEILKDKPTDKDINKLKKLIKKLKQNNELINRYGNDPHIVGYSRSELERMIKL